MFLDFLAGNQEFHCTPWGMPTRNIFGWQKPCYLLGEGYAETFTELMETTDWDAYGTGRYEKCANCMAHCGYEATAADAMMKHPLEALTIALARRQDRRPDGAGNLARKPAAGAIRLRQQCAADAVANARQRGARESRESREGDGQRCLSLAITTIVARPPARMLPFCHYPLNSASRGAPIGRTRAALHPVSHRAGITALEIAVARHRP